MATAALQLPIAITGAALPVAYGPVRASGNELLNYQLSDNSRVILRILGEGVWDGIDRLWINGKLVDITDVNLVHFHNGFDGTLGAGLAPSSNGGDQLVDNFWSLLPANYQRLTYSRKAYLMVHVAQDPQAPSPNVDIIGDYRTMRVRIFDNAGVQTAFQYSTNPAWHILDLKIRQMLNREWTSAGAAAAGGDLTAAMKARLDFVAFAAAADWCDHDIGGGIKRFEAGIGLPQLTGLQQVLNQLCTLSQTYIIESSGKIGLYPDQARASTFTLTSSHITAGTFNAPKTQLRGAQNRFIATFRDLNPQKNADIDTSANTGLSRTANVLTVKVPAGQVHGFLVNDNVEIVNPDTASFAGTIKVATVIDARTFTGAQTGANATSGGGYVGTTESRFAQRTKIVDHEQHQLTVGQRGLNLTPIARRVILNVDLGNNTMERVERLLNFIKVRNLGADTTPYIAPFTAEVQASMNAVDAGGNALIAQLPGDIITVDKSVSEEFAGDWEIIPRMRFNRAGSGSFGDSGAGQSAQADTIDLMLKQYLPGAFSDPQRLGEALKAMMPGSMQPVSSSTLGCEHAPHPDGNARAGLHRQKGLVELTLPNVVAGDRSIGRVHSSRGREREASRPIKKPVLRGGILGQFGGLAKRGQGSEK
jgi:hypothetical protein